MRETAEGQSARRNTARWLAVLSCFAPMRVLLIGFMCSGKSHIGRLVAQRLGLPHVDTDRLVEQEVGPLLPWIASLYTGAGLLGALAVRWRGDYLIGPAVLWSVFFAGATYAHLHTEIEHGGIGPHGVMWILASHGLVSVVLLALLWRARRSAEDRLAPV